MPITHRLAATRLLTRALCTMGDDNTTTRAHGFAMHESLMPQRKKGLTMANEDYATVQAIEDAHAAGVPESELIWFPGYDLWHALYYER